MLESSLWIKQNANNHMKISYLSLLFLILWSCSSAPKKPNDDFLKNKKLPTAQKIKRILERDYLNSLGLTEKEINWSIELYRSTNYRPLFSNDSFISEKGKTALALLKNPLQFGLPDKRGFIPSKQLHPLEKEILIAVHLAEFATDLHKGCLDFNSEKLKEKSPFQVDSFRVSLQHFSIKKPQNWCFKIGPSDSTYQFLARQWFAYSQAHKIDSLSFHVKTEKEDSSGYFEKVKSVLVQRNYLDSLADSTQVIEQLKSFQSEHGLNADGKIGKYTAQALNESTTHLAYRVVFALERMRRQTARPKKFVRINLPEFKLYYVENDTLRAEHRIIIGKVTNQTPELESEIYRIVCYPFWRVPASITKKETLPECKRSKNYLARNHFKIYSGEREVNPESVNWQRLNSFPYTAVQQPGKWNSLGIIKFEFNNAHSVYVHDTPTKSLFNNAFRSYSHGCMRCQFPVDLAKTMLKYDSIGRKEPFTAEKLDSILSLEKNFPIPLKNRVPIYIEYTTVVAYRDRLVFFMDLYDREERWISIMKKG